MDKLITLMIDTSYKGYLDYETLNILIDEYNLLNHPSLCCRLICKLSLQDKVRTKLLSGVYKDKDLIHKIVFKKCNANHYYINKCTKAEREFILNNSTYEQLQMLMKTWIKIDTQYPKCNLNKEIKEQTDAIYLAYKLGGEK